MAIAVNAILANANVPASLAVPGLHVLSGVVECFFKGDGSGNVIRDTLTFSVGRVNLGSGDPKLLSCVGSPAKTLHSGWRGE